MIELEQFHGTPIRRLRRSEYDVLVERGVFSEDEHLELLEGVLVTVSPQSSEHAEIISRLNYALIRAFGDRALVRIQLPLAVSETSEPEPDVALVPPGDYAKAHPTTAWLVIEVADQSLRKDRDIKGRLYGASGIPEYWIINVPAREIEVYRVPSAEGYRSLTRHTIDERVACERFVDVKLDVSKLLV